MLSKMLFPLILVGGGVALLASSAKANAKKKKIDKALDLGLDDCAVSEAQIDGFAHDKGYQVYYFDVKPTNQQPKPAYANNPNGRAFAVTECSFVQFDGEKWVKDTATQAQFDVWLSGNESAGLPVPPSQDKAYPVNPVNHTKFNEWWYQSEYPENGVMGFFLEGITEPVPIAELLPNTNYTDVVIVLQDGSFWFYENGWHPAQRLAQEYDEWYHA